MSKMLFFAVVYIFTNAVADGYMYQGLVHGGAYVDYGDYYGDLGGMCGHLPCYVASGVGYMGGRGHAVGLTGHMPGYMGHGPVLGHYG